MKLIKLSSLLLMIVLGLSAAAQSSKTGAVKPTSKNYPASFLITKGDLDNLVVYKTNDLVHSKTNKYLNKAVVLANMQTGDTKFLRLKLSFFSNSFLTVQVNGAYSTQIFILSDDKSVFYKSKAEGDNFIMKKCEEDEIISE